MRTHYIIASLVSASLVLLPVEIRKEQRVITDHNLSDRFSLSTKKLEGSTISLVGRLQTTVPDLPITAYSLDEDLERTNISLLGELPTIHDYHGLTGIEVYQAEARYLNPDNVAGGLYTSNALPCVILIAMARERYSHQLQRIGMAHIDRGISRESIVDFYDRLKKSPEDFIEIYVLSGVKENALKVLKASRDSNAVIKFFNADLEGHRGDSAIVDKTGRIYYGHSSDLYGSSILSVSDDFDITREIRTIRFEQGWGNLVFRN